VQDGDVLERHLPFHEQAGSHELLKWRNRWHLP
jgi:hypothetical protein